MILRKIFSAAFALVLGISAAFAQQPVSLSGKVPSDPAIRKGTLDNGMTYYIRHNAKPEGMASFYILHNVGAIQEEDNQLGLAHFLEHMAFNGTKNLPDKGLINYLESVGASFARNINAMTGLESTFYMLNDIPMTREGVMDTALLVLHDWSHFITLDPVEIDKERGVIIEELRRGRNASARIADKIFPVIFKGTKYAERMKIIGTEEGLRTFPRQAIVDFYNTWYRPDFQAVIVVGDIDVDQVEAKIKKTMADIPAPVNPLTKVEYAIPDNDEPIVIIATDPEMTSTSAEIYFKRGAMPDEMNDRIEKRKLDQISSAVMYMANQRLDEIRQELGNNSPFTSASFSGYQMTPLTEVFLVSVGSRNNELSTAFEAAYTELERILKHGFTEPELERYKINTMNNARNIYQRRGDRRNGDFVGMMRSNFTDNGPMPSAEQRWVLDSAIISSITVEDANRVIRMYARGYTGQQNRIILAVGPEKEGVTMPTESELLDIMNKVEKSEVEPYEVEVITEPLVSGELKGGAIKKTKKGQYGSTVLTLSNGMKVVLKTTDFSADRISMNGIAKGGLSLVSDEDYNMASSITSYFSYSGLGNFNPTQLSKLLTGKSASIGLSIGGYSHSMSGNSTVKDVETMLQLAYLRFTQPRYTREAFDRMVENTRIRLTNSESTPDFIFRQNVNKTNYGGNIRMMPLTLETVSNVETKYDRIEPIFNMLYGNPADFTFFFVGDFDIEQITPLIVKYLGSVPAAKGKKLDYRDDGVRRVKGEVINHFEVDMQTPKSTVRFDFSGPIKDNLENVMTLNALREVLYTRYFEAIREDKGGTYGVSMGHGIQQNPIEYYYLQVQFDTDPDKVDELSAIVRAEIETIAKEGPRVEDLAKTKESWAKRRPESLKNNGTWMNYLTTYYIDGVDNYAQYEKAFEAVTAEKVQELAKKVLKDGNMVNIVMGPKK